MEENGVEYYPLNCVGENEEEIAEGGNTIADVGFIQIVNELGSDEVIEIHQGFDGEVVDAIFVACPPDKCDEGVPEGTLKCTISSDVSTQRELYTNQTILRQGQHLAEGQITLCHVDGAGNKSGQEAILVEDPNVPGAVSTVIFMPANKNLSSGAPENEKLMQLARVAQCAKLGSLLTDQEANNECVIDVNVGEYLTQHAAGGESVSELHVLNQQCETYTEAYFDGSHIVTCNENIDKEVLQDVAAVADYQIAAEGNVSTDQNAEDVYVTEQGYQGDGEAAGETVYIADEGETMASSEGENLCIIDEGNTVVEGTECDPVQSVSKYNTVDGENDNNIVAGVCETEYNNGAGNDETQYSNVQNEIVFNTVRGESACGTVEEGDVFPQQITDGYESSELAKVDDEPFDAKHIQNSETSASEADNTHPIEIDYVSTDIQPTVIKLSTCVKQDNVSKEVVDENKNKSTDIDTMAQNEEFEKDVQITADVEHTKKPEVDEEQVGDSDENTSKGEDSLQDDSGDISIEHLPTLNRSGSCNESEITEESVEPVVDESMEPEDKIEFQNKVSLEQPELLDDDSNDAFEGDNRELIPEPIMKPPKKTYARACKFSKEQFTDDNEKKVAGIESDLKLLSSSDALSFSCDTVEETSDVEDTVTNVEIISLEPEKDVSLTVSKNKVQTSKKPSQSESRSAKRRKFLDANKPETDTAVQEEEETITDTKRNRRSTRKRTFAPGDYKIGDKSNDDNKIDNFDENASTSSGLKKQKVSKAKSLQNTSLEKEDETGRKLKNITKVKLSNKSSKWFYKKSGGGKEKNSNNYDPSNEYIFTDSDDSSHDFSSPSFSGYSPSKKRGRPLGSRNKIINNNKTWDRLLQSSPSKIKTTNYLSKLQKRFARTNGSSSSHSPLQVNKLQQVVSSKRTLDRVPRKELNVHYIEQPTSSETRKPSSYSCFICQYETDRIQTFIFHTKSCLATSVPYCFDEVTDMDRRQRIRGDFEEEDSQSPSSSSSPADDIFMSNRVSDIDDDDSSDEAEFRENDVVWVERTAGLWPGWIRQVHVQENRASVYLIDYPNKRSVDMKVSFRKLTNFHDADQNKKFLSEGKSKLNGEHFIKAVQKAEEFVRKRVLGMSLSAAAFFTKGKSADIIKDLEGPTRTIEDVVSVEVDEESDPMKKLSVEVLKYIKEGNVDDYVVSVYNKDIICERHRKFFSHNVLEKKELVEQSWFGPIQDAEQNYLYDYFVKLFKRRCLKCEDVPFLVRYIYYVWCPEAIVKAISEVNKITQEEAEILFANGGITDALNGL